MGTPLAGSDRGAGVYGWIIGPAITMNFLVILRFGYHANQQNGLRVPVGQGNQERSIDDHVKRFLGLAERRRGSHIRDVAAAVVSI